MRGLTITIARAFTRNADLVLVWMGLLIAQHLVPVSHMLGREDLVPWMVLSLSVVAMFRARRFGNGPHPMLTPRVSNTNALVQRAAAALTPWALMFIYDAARTKEPVNLGFAGGVVVGAIVLVAVGGTHGQTAWQPIRGIPVGGIAAASLLVLGTVGGAGFAAGALPEQEVVQAVARAVIIGMSFLAIGLMAARIQNQRQRAAAGLKDGRPYRQPVFPAALATLGPSTGLAVVFLVVRGIGFNQAFVISLLIVVWAAVVWPKPSPIMVSCVLHEVVPVGGADPTPAGGQANAFDLPPEGALRFHPLKTKRTLVMHPWMVPVRSSRIAELDDPIKPLWDLPPPLLPDHILGEAAFEPDPLTKQDQWEVITLRLKGRADTSSLSSGDAQTRRMVILRAFPAPGHSARPRMATYRWEDDVPADTVQVLDPTVPYATLRDGDILLLSAEGVAKAFEVEIGAPVYRVADGNIFRAPQLEDYVEVG